MKTKDQIFEELKPRIIEFLGVKPEKVTIGASFRDDLGVWGDDGDELFEFLDEYYDVDWTELDLGVLFGNEGSGFLLPWHLKNSCVMYQAQPCTVNDVVDAIQLGKWCQKPLIPISNNRRFALYIGSYFQWGFISSILAFGIYANWPF